MKCIRLGPDTRVVIGVAERRRALDLCGMGRRDEAIERLREQDAALREENAALRLMVEELKRQV